MEQSSSGPPNRVPVVVALAGFTMWNRREAWWFLAAAIVAIVLVGSDPSHVRHAFGLALVVAVLARLSTLWRWFGVLRWGRIADIVGVDTAPDGEHNERIAHASGWNVQRRWYTGQIVISAVRFRVDDTAAHVFVRGLPFTDGVIVAHAMKPSNAMAISDFPIDLRLDGRGRWSVWFPGGYWRQVAATTALYAQVLVLFAGSFTLR